MHHHKFILSCPTFGGFSCTVTPSNTDTLQTLVRHILGRLEDTLVQHQLYMLRDQLHRNRQKYHIHTHTMEAILQADQPLDVYVCNC
jgi:hypothetical protein